MHSQRIPILLRLPLRLTPSRLHATLIARAVNKVLDHEPCAGRLAALNGKTIQLKITDLGIAIFLHIREGRVSAATGSEKDVAIRGSTADFLQLAARREDPDTLFFQRRLSLEGDTDTGLHLKNFLDNLELDWESQLTQWIGGPLARATLSVARESARRLPLPPGFRLGTRVE